jgi:pimeloyl-ACP methyl ester carboxylesterase
VTDLLVLHDLGAPGGAEWAAAFAGWPGQVLAPDLPGHHGTPPPTGGQYETGDAVYVAIEVLRRAMPEDLLVVGVGHGGAAAQILALGGRAVGLVLVDGLGGPWLDADGIDARRREMRRRILTTPVALSAPPAGADDPRATMMVRAADRGFAVRQAAAMPVATLLIETPASTTPDADELADHFDRAVLRRIDARDPARVADLVGSWWTNP